MHVDDFIDDHRSDAYASWVLEYFRKPAMLKIRFWPYMENHRLFCTHSGDRYRVTGASRLGDVWLTKDFEQDVGYELRVDVAACSAWGPSP